ncbi:hypothetical protein FC756_23610 [Lysinibacillus mangiferihumi]|uniref:Uncharacterized protein n=1 Tax=Lysinibacillus mangiferihumi TaxID=1130819 RepID=A0A4U2XZR9_9BACI|nr:hypothetical protein [Lysinibacillus mangiferihumi]TKI53520.1 hypothetical protein FC756_23610 [Lysinibacillus mangiferihumi]
MISYMYGAICPGLLAILTVFVAIRSGFVAILRPFVAIRSGFVAILTLFVAIDAFNQIKSDFCPNAKIACSLFYCIESFIPY